MTVVDAVAGSESVALYVPVVDGDRMDRVKVAVRDSVPELDSLRVTVRDPESVELREMVRVDVLVPRDREPERVLVFEDDREALAVSVMVCVSDGEVVPAE